MEIKKIILSSILILMFSYLLFSKIYHHTVTENKIKSSMAALNVNLNSKSMDAFKKNMDTLTQIEKIPRNHLTDKELTIKKIELRLNSFLNKINSFEDLKIIAPYLKIHPNILNDIPSITPLIKNNYVTTSSFGIRTHPITKKVKNHKGYDLAADKNSRIYATANGRVSLVQESPNGYGKHIEIKHRFGYTTKYGHLNKILVENRQEVKQGDLIGLVGSTGLSTGPHLHYEVIKNNTVLDPFLSFNLKYEYYKKIVEKRIKKRDSIKGYNTTTSLE